MSLGNALVDILRGSDTDEWDDTIDAPIQQQTDIPMSIVEQNPTSTTNKDDRPQTIRRYTARCALGVDVQDGDRLKIRNTGEVFIVDQIYQPRTTVGLGQKRLDLRRIS